MPILKKISLSRYPKCRYKNTISAIFLYDFEEYLKADCTVLEAVNTTYFYDMADKMDENGMEKFVAMLAGMLFMIEHDEVEDDQAYGTYHDILDFETGEYDDLFLPEDLELIRADIKKIKDYLANHPELLEERPRKHNNEQINRWKRRQ